MNRQYELAVIGSGPAGQKAAIQGAKLGKRVAIVDRADLRWRHLHSPRRHSEQISP